MEQHVVLIYSDIAGKDLATLLIQGRGVELGLECMEDGYNPSNCLGAVLAAGGRDSGYLEGFASFGASPGGPGPG